MNWWLILLAVVIAFIVGLRNGGWSTPGDSSTSGRDARPYVIAIGICWVAPLAVMWVLHVVLPPHNTNAQCDVHGFGCVPATQQALVIPLWELTLPFTFIAGLIACAIIAGVQRGRRKRDANLLARRPTGDPPE